MANFLKQYMKVSKEDLGPEVGENKDLNLLNTRTTNIPQDGTGQTNDEEVLEELGNNGKIEEAIEAFNVYLNYNRTGNKYSKLALESYLGEVSQEGLWDRFKDFFRDKITENQKVIADKIRRRCEQVLEIIEDPSNLTGDFDAAVKEGLKNLRYTYSLFSEKGELLNSKKITDGYIDLMDYIRSECQKLHQKYKSDLETNPNTAIKKGIEKDTRKILEKAKDIIEKTNDRITFNITGEIINVDNSNSKCKFTMDDIKEFTTDYDRNIKYITNANYLNDAAKTYNVINDVYKVFRNLSTVERNNKDAARDTMDYLDRLRFITSYMDYVPVNYLVFGSIMYLATARYLRDNRK